VLGMSNICCWPLVWRPQALLWGWCSWAGPFVFWASPGFVAVELDDMVKLNGVWAFMCVCCFLFEHCYISVNLRK
jgi:hypothetical protein